jgi:hypothetical protein
MGQRRYTLLAEYLAVPFQTVVLGLDVTVKDIDLSGRGESWPSAIVRRGSMREIE